MSVNLAAGIFGAGGQFFDTNGKVLNAGILNTYAAGTTTPVATFTTSLGNVANLTSITLGVDGRPPNEIWITAGTTVRFDLLDSLSNLIKTYDNVPGTNDISGIGEWILISLTPVFISSTSFSLTGNQTALLPNAMRLKTANTGGTMYGAVVSSSYAAIPNTTTFVIANDVGSALDAGLSSVSYSILSPANPSVSADYVLRKATLVTSAGVTNIWAIAGEYLHVTGGTVTTVTSFGTALYAGNERTVIADASLVITNGAAIQCLGAANISSLAGDSFVVRAETTTIAKVVSYFRQTGATPVKQPSRTVLTTGTSVSYTTPTNATRINIRLVGGGGGGGGATVNNGTTGNNTTFSTLTANGGALGQASAGAAGGGGAASGGDINIPGGNGGGAGSNAGGANAVFPGGSGGGTAFGGNGGGGGAGGTGGNGAANSGGGGGGGGGNSGTNSGAGGGGGGYVEKLILNPVATYLYTVALPANGGAAGTFAGGNGAAGIIVIDEYYN